MCTICYSFTCNSMFYHQILSILQTSSTMMSVKWEILGTGAVPSWLVAGLSLRMSWSVPEALACFLCLWFPLVELLLPVGRNLLPLPQQPGIKVSDIDQRFFKHTIFKGGQFASFLVLYWKNLPSESSSTIATWIPHKSEISWHLLIRVLFLFRPFSEDFAMRLATVLSVIVSVWCAWRKWMKSETSKAAKGREWAMK